MGKASSQVDAYGKWDACCFDFNPDDLKGRVCYGGLDLSSTTDITAFVLVFPPTEEDEHYYVLPYFGYLRIIWI